VQQAGEPVVAVDRRQHPDFVTASAELLRQRLDVSEDTARVRVGVGADQTYAHPT
jgi:hypothetical protein